MADLVRNSVHVVSRSQAAIDHFIQSVRGFGWSETTEQVFSFQSIVPNPNWSYNIWGTTWDALFHDDMGTYQRLNVGDETDGFHTVFYSFHTKGSPPFKIFSTLRARFPDVWIFWNAFGDHGVHTTWRSDTDECLILPDIDALYERAVATMSRLAALADYEREPESNGDNEDSNASPMSVLVDHA